MIGKRNAKMSEIRERMKISLFPQQQNHNQVVVISNERKSTSVQKRIQHLKEEKPTRPFSSSFFNLYMIGGVIGQGAHGIVKICYKKQSSLQFQNFGLIPTKYAVKQIINANDPELVNTIVQTFNINQSLNHITSIIKAFDLFIDENQETAFWVMEYFEQNSLQCELQHRQFTKKQIKSIIRQLAQAMHAIHDKGVCHRDIKPDNILIKVSDLPIIKLIDFGVSKQYKKTEMWTRTGTILYSAPEILVGGGYNEKIDIWAAGVILYQLLCNKLPFFGNIVIDTIELITDPETTIDKNHEFHELDYLEQDILKRMLQKIPNKRLSARELLLHPWLCEQQSPSKAQDDLSLSNYYKEDNKINSQYDLEQLNPFPNTSPLYSSRLEATAKHEIIHVHHVHKGEIIIQQPKVNKSSSLELDLSSQHTTSTPT